MNIGDYYNISKSCPRLKNSRPETARSEKRPSSGTLQVFGRIHNPLQYIRNRRVRNRERKSFDPEAEGWRSTERVRSWVDSVSSQRLTSVPVPTSIPSLPTFSGEHVSAREDSSSTTNSPSANASTAVKVRRPKTEWITTPWDLLADAYWLDQDSNKNLIEDRDGHQLYPVHLSHVEPGPKRSQDFTDLSVRRSSSIPRHEQIYRLNENGTSKGLEKPSKERGRQRHQLRDSITSLNEPDSSQDRKSRWHRKGIRSHSSSSSDDSFAEGFNHISWLGGRRDVRERQDSAILDRQIRSLLAEESNNNSGVTQSLGRPRSTFEEVPTTFEAIDVARQSMPPLSPTLVKSHMNTSQAGENLSLLHQSLQQRETKRESFEGSRSLSPRHSDRKDALPDIAIEISRGNARTGSPRKPLPSPQKVARMDLDNKQNGDLLRQGLLNVDSGVKPNIEDRKSVNQAHVSSTPSDGFLSPKSAESFRPLRYKPSNSKSAKGQKDHGEVESRLRGILKGPSRLAEMVGSPVSRVGGILWRREETYRPSNIATPISSNASESSESDGGSSITKRKFDNVSPTNAQQLEQTYPRTVVDEAAPEYHVTNLPTFKSSFSKHDKDNGPLDPNGYDHISWQQTASRERSRSSRFRRLAPPGLRIRSSSPSPSTPLVRIETADSDMTREESVQHGPTDFDGHRNVHQPSSTFRPLLDLPVTGLTKLEVRQNSSEQRPKIDDKRHWSISDRGVSTFRDVVTVQDITRVQALLLSSAVKANNIVRHASEIPDRPLAVLQEIQRGSHIPVQETPRSREHILAARLLDQSIEDNSTRLREAANRMSITDVNELHDRIKALNDGIMSTLTPTVRALADEADLLSSELSATQRLSVKRVNDDLDLIIRRKRRRFRWVRRGGYLVLEWTLLGLMWWVWLIVVIIRLIRGSIAAIFAAAKWFLWL